MPSLWRSHEDDSGRYFEGVEDALLGFAGGAAAAAGKSLGRRRNSVATAAEYAAAAAAKEAAANPELYPYLANLAVRSGARRIGLGKALVEATEDCILARFPSPLHQSGPNKL